MKNNDVIQHYASPYYDPVKAHEYYMEHRELKSRHSTAHLSDEQKLERGATLAAVRSGVKKAQKEDTTKMRDEHKANIKAYRDETKQRIKDVSDQIKNAINLFNRREYNSAKIKLKSASNKKQNAINKKASDAVTKASRDTNRQIATLKKRMASTSSKSQKIAYQRQINSLKSNVERTKFSANIRKTQDSAKESKALSKNLSAVKTTGTKAIRDKGEEYKKTIRDNATETIKQAREAFNERIKAVRENYKTTLENELENVKSSYDTASSGGYADQIAAASKHAEKQSSDRRERNKKK